MNLEDIFGQIQAERANFHLWMAPVVFAQLINALWHIDADLWGPSTPSNKGQ